LLLIFNIKKLGVKIGIFEQPTAALSSSGLGQADFKGVRYCYINVGNKTIGLQYVISNYVTTPLVMIIDDDVIIPNTIDMNGALRDLDDNEKMKAVAFTIRGIEKPNVSFLPFAFSLLFCLAQQ
jgi:hypothetical protein